MIPARSPMPSPFAVHEGARIDLIDDAALPPQMFHAASLGKLCA